MKVSIIVPMYNAEQTLGRCIDSLLRQTFTDIEVILVDDCSRDHTLSIARKKAGQDSRILVLSNSENLGVSAARNRGLDIVSGDWVAFCDADDYPDCRWIEDFVDLACDDVDMVVQGFYCDHWPGHPDGRIVAYSGTADRDVVVDALCRHQVFGYLWCKFFRSSMIRESGLRFAGYAFLEDEMFCLQYLKSVHCITCTDHCNYHYNRPDFYAKYGTIDSFDVNKCLYRQACESFGQKPLRVKDMFVERCADWLIASYRQKQKDRRQRLNCFLKEMADYLPQAHTCRRRIRLLRFFLLPHCPKFSELLLQLYLRL